MQRREFLRFVCASAPALSAIRADNQTALYFVDGYHGGVRGHMPPGAWRDIVTRLAADPRWKLCLDIEALSWQRLAQTDPQALARISHYLHGPAGSPRIEMVGGTFSQPYGWAVMGESNIRQLVRGLELIRKAFPGLPVDTYAMQEPCWASCLPQILNSLGFRYAVLKNPSTAWGGYSVGVDAESVNWVGPDGAAIPTVPRYACEELLDTWRTEAQTGSEAFAEKCVAHGIPHPAGMCFQDLGWAARPNVEGNYVHFVTWREYMHSVAGTNRRNWSLGIEGIRCALPWGERTLQTLARQVRETETKLCVGEKIASIAALCRRKPYPQQQLQDAEDQLLWSQHHDAWITATTRSGRDAWAFQAAAETWQADDLIDTVIRESLEALRAPAGGQTENSASYIEVWNTTAHNRSDIVEIDVATDVGTQSLSVRDGRGVEILSQAKVIRKYVGDEVDRVRGDVRSPGLQKGESIGAVHLLFRAEVPATGRAVYTMLSNPTRATLQVAGVTATQSDGDSVIIESDLYRIHFEGKLGGTISSLFVKNLNKEFCASGPRRFHEFRGYFVEKKEWQSSASNPASLEIVEAGPVRATIAISGHIASVPYRTLVSVVQGQARIDIHTQFRFEQDTWIGDPWEIKPEDRMKGRRRSEYDDRYKLLALFPIALASETIYKNAAFDVCKSENANTFFNSWDTIKHNIIVNWVDAYDEGNDAGLAILSDHTTSYAHGEDHPLSLVLGWGWDGGYWWGKCPLRGVQEARYALIPHAGGWKQAGLWSETEKWTDSLLAQVSNVPQVTALQSLVRVVRPGLMLSSMKLVEGHLFLRFFNAESAISDHEIVLSFRPTRIERIELDGTVRDLVPVETQKGGLCKIKLKVPLFGLCTLRVSGSAMREKS